MYTEYNSYNNQMQNNPDPDIYHQDEDSGKNKFFGLLWKILLVIIILILLFLVLIRFKVISFADKVTPDAVVLNVNEIGIKKGSGYQLISTVLPENADNKQVTFESSDPSIASVNETTGYVSGLKDGTAIITVKTLINNKVTECVVNVGNYNIVPTSLKVNEKNISLAVGYKHTLSYQTTPSNATELNLNFISSDPSIATVDSRGVITGIKEGNVIITVTSANNAVSDTSYVTVYKAGKSTIVDGSTVKTNNYPTKVSLSDESLNILVGSSTKLMASITPENSNTTLTWSSSNSNVAVVNEDGLVTAKGIGSADIIVKTINNLTAICHITVGNYSLKVKQIYITTNYSFMEVGAKKSLFVAFEPSNASNKSINWSSSNSSVASVNSSGVVEAKAIGSAVITATSQDGGFTSTARIEVGGVGTVIPVTSISIGQATRDIYIGSTEQITPSFNPSNATYKAVSFTSSDSNIATVDANGVVRGLKEGTAIITVSTKRENIKANITINVKNNPSVSVSLSTSSVSLNVGETTSISASVKPQTASNQTVSFTSSNSNIVTVDQFGVIRAVGKGTATITVTPNGGGTPSTCIVTVN